jgi:hypothetical protein
VTSSGSAPAALGGSQFYVVSTDQSVVNAKAAANVQRLH